MLLHEIGIHGRQAEQPGVLLHKVGTAVRAACITTRPPVMGGKQCPSGNIAAHSSMLRWPSHTHSLQAVQPYTLAVRLLSQSYMCGYQAADLRHGSASGGPEAGGWGPVLGSREQLRLCFNAVHTPVAFQTILILDDTIAHGRGRRACWASQTLNREPCVP